MKSGYYQCQLAVNVIWNFTKVSQAKCQWFLILLWQWMGVKKEKYLSSQVINQGWKICPYRKTHRQPEVASVLRRLVGTKSHQPTKGKPHHSWHQWPFFHVTHHASGGDHGGIGVSNVVWIVGGHVSIIVEGCHTITVVEWMFAGNSTCCASLIVVLEFSCFVFTGQGCRAPCVNFILPSYLFELAAYACQINSVKSNRKLLDSNEIMLLLFLYAVKFQYM